MFQEYQLIYVEWDDHSSDGATWHSPEDVSDAVMKCCSIGWLYKDTPKKLILIGSAIIDKTYEQQVSDVRHILKSCITKTTVLRKVRKPKPTKRKKNMMVAEELPEDVAAIAIGSPAESAEHGQS